MHQQAGTWFWDQDVFDFVAHYLHLMPQHSFRTYINAWERKAAGLPWQSAVLDRCLSGLTLEVAKLRCDTMYKSEEERAQAFVRQGLGCRATYFNHAKRLRRQNEVQRIELTNHAPPEPPARQEQLLDVLKRRHKYLGHG